MPDKLAVQNSITVAVMKMHARYAIIDKLIPLFLESLT
jgi:hypothetical protein